ncbi:hypothetical protein [Mycobacterium sp. E136]|nr:hypothetical protein [Mycobacterium sp. E136]
MDAHIVAAIGLTRPAKRDIESALADPVGKVVDTLVNQLAAERISPR